MLIYVLGGLVAKSYLTLVTPWTVARQAPLSMGFSRQEYWSGLPRPPPGHLPSPGIQPASLTSPVRTGGFLPLKPPGKDLLSLHWVGRSIFRKVSGFLRLSEDTE